MTDKRLHTVAATGLVIGALLGMAGAFAPSAGLRGLAWGIDGVALVVATALLGLHYLQRGDTQLAAGFLVYCVGETLMVSGSSMELSASTPTIAAGTALWSAALALVSASPVIPRLVRVTGAIASVLFAVTALQIFGGAQLTPLSAPLPFYGFPFLAATLLGWAWLHRRPGLATAGVEPLAGQQAQTIYREVSISGSAHEYETRMRSSRPVSFGTVAATTNRNPIP